MSTMSTKISVVVNNVNNVNKDFQHFTGENVNKGQQRSTKIPGFVDTRKGAYIKGLRRNVNNVNKNHYTG